MASNKKTKRNYPIRNSLKCVSGFAEQQEKAKLGLGEKLSLETSKDNHVLSHVAGNHAANLALARRVTINDVSWFVPLCTPNTLQQKIFLEHIVARIAT